MNKEEVRKKIEQIVRNAWDSEYQIVGVISRVVAEKVLEIPELAIVDREAKLPEIPEFTYDRPENMPYLRRGAINYMKLLSGYAKEVKE